MVSPLIILIGIVAATTANAVAMDFTPRESYRELEGAHFSELLFTDGTSEVSYEPPAGWSYRGEKNMFSLWAPEKDQVDAEMAVSDSGGAPVPLDAAGMNVVRARAAAVLPRGSQQVRMVSEGKGAVMIDGQETYEAIFAYGLSGQTFETSVTLVFMGDRLMTIQVSAHPNDFAGVYRAFRRSVFSLQWHHAAEPQPKD